MFGPDIALGYLVGWLWRKARRVAGDVDRAVDEDLDALVKKLHEALRRKLLKEPALARLEVEAANGSTASELSPETRDRAASVLKEQWEQDPAFAAQAEELLRRIAAADPDGMARARTVVNARDGGIGVVNYGRMTVEYGGREQAPRAGRVVRLGPRPSELVGRARLLGSVYDSYSWPPTSPEKRILCGIGGVGKTSTAVEYAYKYEGHYEVVWQFNAEDPASLAGQIGQLADALGLRDPSGTADALTRVQNELANRTRPWLLVLDNITDAAVVDALTPSAGPGHVIVTSQLTAWPAGAVEIPVLERAVAVEYMLAHARETDAAEAGRLVDALGCLPLALAQAANYLRSTGHTMAEYNLRLSSSPTQLLLRGIPGDYGKAVAGAWSAAVASLESTVPAAVSLLRVLSFCAPDAVPVRLLLSPGSDPVEVGDAGVTAELAKLTDDEYSLDDALVALRGFSLISTPLRGAVSLHRLVQHVTLSVMDPNPDQSEAWRRASAALVSRAVPDDAYLPGNWPDLAALFAHVHAVLPGWADAHLVLANYLGATGNHAAGRDAARAFVEACEEHYGALDPHALYGRHCLARWTGRAGDPAGACRQLAALLPQREEVLGPEHPDTLSTRHNLAHWTGEAGDEETARDMFAALLPIRDRVLGEKHPDSLDARHALANRTGRAGDPAAARDQFQAILAGYEEVMKVDHPGTLTTRQALGHWTGEAGDPVGARRLLEMTVRQRAKVQRPEHPDTLSARRELARWIGEGGDPAAARDLLAELLPVQLRVQGPNHPDTVRTFADLQRWTGEAQRGGA